MPFFDALKSIVNLAPSSPAMKVVTITSNADADAVPFGFFNVECHSGRVSLGYRGISCGTSYQVGTTVVDGAKRVTLSVPRSELPTVHLNFQRPQGDGVQHVAGASIIDTDSLDNDSTVTWDGAAPASGVGWR